MDELTSTERDIVNAFEELNVFDRVMLYRSDGSFARPKEGKPYIGTVIWKRGNRFGVNFGAWGGTWRRRLLCKLPPPNGRSGGH